MNKSTNYSLIIKIVLIIIFTIVFGFLLGFTLDECYATENITFGVNLTQNGETTFYDLYSLIPNNLSNFDISTMKYSAFIGQDDLYISDMPFSARIYEGNIRLDSSRIPNQHDCSLLVFTFSNNTFSFEQYNYRNNISSIGYYFENWILNDVIYTETSQGFGFTNFTTIFDTSNYSNVVYNTNFLTNSVANIGMPDLKVYYTPTLMIDDYNFRKSFKFDFEIEQIREDTKYFTFLKSYTRNSYNSVTANFQVISVTTPEGYDYSNYYNYLYFDNRAKRLYLPAGCEINIYEGSGNNNSTIDLDLITSTTLPHVNVGSLTALTPTGNFFIGEYNYTDLMPTDYHLNSPFIGNILCTIINNLDLQIGGSPTSLRISVLDDFLPYLDIPMTIDEFRFQTSLQALYYANDYGVSYCNNFEDFCFSNSSIVSYENSKYDNLVDNSYYNFYRKTNVYNQENKINTNLYRFQYTDSEDVSSMLPNGISTEYLSSPFYEDNYNSSSGGNISYNITQIFYDYSTINYGQENSPLMREPTSDFLNDTNTTDNSVLDNQTTDKIEGTSDANWFANVYKALLDIQDTLHNIEQNTSNFTSNLTYNVKQNFNYLFIPNLLEYTDLLDDFDAICEEHLGIVYQPIDFSVFVLQQVANNIDTDADCVLNIPQVEFHDHTLIPAYTFNFSETLFVTSPFSTIHEFFLTAIDFTMVFLVIKYAISIYKEVFGSNDN